MSAIDNYRKARDLKSLDWKPYYPNNVPSNGLAGCYAIVNDGDGRSARKFTILFQRREDEKGFTHEGEEPELYILLVKTYTEPKEDYREPSEEFKMSELEDINDFGSFVRAYDSIKKAKAAALTQYKAIYMYCMSFMLSNEEKEILMKEQKS